MKRKTQGVDLKVPAQALSTVIVFLLSYFGIDLPAEVAAAIAVLIGAALGALAPAPKTVIRQTRTRPDVKSAEGMYDPIYLIVLIIVIVVLVWVVTRLFN